jgi:hypothetical protein
MDSSITCQYCKVSVKNLKRHLQSVHKDIARHKCKVCSHAFVRRRDLLSHLSKYNHFVPRNRHSDPAPEPQLRRVVEQEIPQYFTAKRRRTAAPSYQSVVEAHSIPPRRPSIRRRTPSPVRKMLPPKLPSEVMRRRIPKLVSRDQAPTRIQFPSNKSPLPRTSSQPDITIRLSAAEEAEEDALLFEDKA